MSPTAFQDFFWFSRWERVCTSDTRVIQGGKQKALMQTWHLNWKRDSKNETHGKPAIYTALIIISSTFHTTFQGRWVTRRAKAGSTTAEPLEDQMPGKAAQGASAEWKRGSPFYERRIWRDKQGSRQNGKKRSEADNHLEGGGTSKGDSHVQWREKRGLVLNQEMCLDKDANAGHWGESILLYNYGYTWVQRLHVEVKRFPFSVSASLSKWFKGILSSSLHHIVGIY